MNGYRIVRIPDILEKDREKVTNFNETDCIIEFSRKNKREHRTLKHGVYKIANDGMDPSHRFTSDRTIRVLETIEIY